MSRHPFGWSLPPGVTDRMIDEASPGYWDEPEPDEEREPMSAETKWTSGKWRAVKPDAHLIAAAPELYAALATIRNKLHAHNRPDSMSPAYNRLRLECRDIADAALASARGEPAQ